ncbi:F-box protein [Legionella sp. WA2024007413]
MHDNSRDSTNYDKNYEEKKLSEAMDASAEPSEDGITTSPNSLQDMILARVAQDPFLSIELIRNKSYADTHISEVLKKITPFIGLLPAEVKCELLTFLPIRDWISLFKVSKEWQKLGVSAAELFLNDVARDKPTVISIEKFEAMLNSLIKNVESYSQKTRRRPDQVEEIKNLKKEVSSLKLPLAKLFRCEKRLEEVQRAIAREYGTSTMVSFFSGPQNSQLHQILESTRREIQKFTQSSWFKQVQFCVNLCPHHVIAHQFSDAFLEINNLQNDFKVPLLSAAFRNS